MSSAFDRIAEERIARAAAAGEFDRLPGAGRPLDLDDDLLVPAEVRMSNRILKNAGCLPPELETLKEARGAADDLAGARNEESVRNARRRLAALQMRLESAGSLSRLAWQQYAPQLVKRFSGCR
jgi:hypothetical protein